MGKAVLYTTIHPGVTKYLPAWWQSVVDQTDHEFDLMIAIDSMDIASVNQAIGAEIQARWVIAYPDETPSQLRQRAFEKIVRDYDMAIFVDSDDLLERTRVESAKKHLSCEDVNACSLRLIDEGGRDLNVDFHLDPSEDIKRVLPYYNVFGLSNTAYRTFVLAKCLPIPTDCLLVDWFLATRAMLSGARMGFDLTCQMAYRQYDSNIARVIAPFTPNQILKSAEYVLHHYDLIFEHVLFEDSSRFDDFRKARSYVFGFYTKIKDDSQILERYVKELNELAVRHLWWTCVAHPKLENIWKN
jgi:hypothetical protein